MYYLSDRRQKLTGAMNQLSLDHPLPSEDSLPPLSSLPAAELHRLPNVPFSELGPEELLRTAQVIYTALLKVYLVARPILVGSLCRIENWCDVEEVEELLKAQNVSGGPAPVGGEFADVTEIHRSHRPVPRQEDAFQGAEDAA